MPSTAQRSSGGGSGAGPLQQHLQRAEREEAHVQQQLGLLQTSLAEQQVELQGRLAAIQALSERRDVLAAQVAAAQALSLRAQQAANARQAELQDLGESQL